MTTSTATGVHRWSRIMRLLAPGPVAFGLHVFVDPAVWRAIDATRRELARPPARNQAIARREER